MPLYHSTSSDKLPSIRNSGLRQGCAKPVQGMEDRGVWLFSEERMKVYHHNLGDRIILSIDSKQLNPQLLTPYYSVPEQMRQPGSVPDSYIYRGDIPPNLISLADTPIARLTSWVRSIFGK